MCLFFCHCNHKPPFDYEAAMRKAARKNKRDYIKYLLEVGKEKEAIEEIKKRLNL